MEKYKDYPEKAYKEITFMLYNYGNIDELIEKRKRDLMDCINVSKNEWLKSIHQDGHTLEDIVIKFDTDITITRLLKWKKVLNTFYSKVYDLQNPILYYFIKYKYKDKLKNEVIMERLNIGISDFKKLDLHIKRLIYEYAVKTNLYK